MIQHPYIIANWKMQLSPTETQDRIRALQEKMKTYTGPVRMLVCPSFTALPAVQQLLTGSQIRLGAQDVFWAERGAYTGEVSPLDLQALGVTFVIVGHSERRQLLGESDEMVSRKMMSALSHGLQPVLCVGETAEQRARSDHEMTIRHQLEQAFRAMPPPNQGQRVVIAYEPIWAIGTGESASPEQALEMQSVVNQTLVDLYGEALVERQFRIIYGGSVNPENILNYVHPERFQGVLAGTASLEVESFASMVNVVSAAWK
jgi:triosephosphate isomerase